MQIFTARLSVFLVKWNQQVSRHSSNCLSGVCCAARLGTSPSIELRKLPLCWILGSIIFQFGWSVASCWACCLLATARYTKSIFHVPHTKQQHHHNVCVTMPHVNGSYCRARRTESWTSNSFRDHDHHDDLLRHRDEFGQVTWYRQTLQGLEIFLLCL